MGEMAARTLLKRLEDHGSWVPNIAIEPELVVRDSTGQAPIERSIENDASVAADLA
jgi:DNA-binding LacI/PurR family transcriptional regulator